MTCNFSWRSSGWVGLLLLACSGTSAVGSGSEGGAAGAAEFAGEGGNADAAGADNDSAAGGASHAGSGPEVESGGNTGDPIAPERSGGAAALAGGSGDAAGGSGDAASGSGAAASGSGAAAGGGATAAGGNGAGTSGAAAGGGSAGGGGNAEELMVPCDVYAAYRVCRRCHTNPPSVAPMSLITLLDLQTFAAAEYQAVSTGVMPLAASLSAEDAMLILDWLAAGAKGVPQAECP